MINQMGNEIKRKRRTSSFPAPLQLGKAPVLPQKQENPVDVVDEVTGALSHGKGLLGPDELEAEGTAKDVPSLPVVAVAPRYGIIDEDGVDRP
jgi:hypothetical protein